MKHIVLISCGKDKATSPVQARHLYIGQLFRKSLAYAERQTPDAIYILSAKHHLLPLDRVTAPYDVTLNDMPAHQVKEWAAAVLALLRAHADLARDRFTILAGDRYRKYLMPQLANADVPLKGLGIGKQLQFLDRAAQ